MLAQYKAFVPVIAMVVAATLQAAIAVYGNGITAHEWGIIFLAFAGAVATYLVPSVSERAPWAKTVVSAFTAGAVTVVDALASGAVDGAVLMTAVVSVLIGLFGTAFGEPAARDYSARHAA